MIPFLLGLLVGGLVVFLVFVMLMVVSDSDDGWGGNGR